MIFLCTRHCVCLCKSTWQQTDRSTLRTEITDAEDYAEQICERLLKLKPHSFTAKQQSYFFKNLKDTLKEGEFLILCDFAENYAFVFLDDACRLARVASLFKFPPIPSQGPFQCAVAWKCHSPGIPKSISWRSKLMKLYLFLKCWAAPSVE